MGRPEGSFPTQHDAIVLRPLSNNAIGRMICYKKSLIHPYESQRTLVALHKKKSSKRLPGPDTIPLLDSMDLDDLSTENYYEKPGF